MKQLVYARRPSLPLFLILPVLALAQTACGTNKYHSPPPHSWDVLSEAEWVNLDRGDAYQLVQRLRPSWLKGRGAGAILVTTRAGGRSPGM